MIALLGIADLRPRRAVGIASRVEFRRHIKQHGLRRVPFFKSRGVDKRLERGSRLASARCDIHIRIKFARDTRIASLRLCGAEVFFGTYHGDNVASAGIYSHECGIVRLHQIFIILCAFLHEFFGSFLECPVKRRGHAKPSAKYGCLPIFLIQVFAHVLDKMGCAYGLAHGYKNELGMRCLIGLLGGNKSRVRHALEDPVLALHQFVLVRAVRRVVRGRFDKCRNSRGFGERQFSHLFAKVQTCCRGNAVRVGAVGDLVQIPPKNFIL